MDTEHPQEQTEAAGGASDVDRRVMRVVCAAIRNDHYDVICAPRHWDCLMRAQVACSVGAWSKAEQGFVNQYGDFLTREEAWKVATEAGQIVRRVGGDEGRLFSENLY